MGVINWTGKGTLYLMVPSGKIAKVPRGKSVRRRKYWNAQRRRNLRDKTCIGKVTNTVLTVHHEKD